MRSQSIQASMPRGAMTEPSLRHVYQSSDWPRQTKQGGSVALALVIWVPALVVAIALVAFGQRLPGILICAVALLVHSLFEPRVTVCALVFAIPLEWMVSVIPGITTASKLLGIYAMLLSLPRIIQAAIPVNWDRSGKWIVFLILWSALSILWSPYPNFAMVGAQSLALVWGIPVLMCIHFRDKRSIRFLMHVFLVASIVNFCGYLFLGDVAELTTTNERLEVGTLVGADTGSSSGNPNIIARDLAIGVIISFYLFMSGSGTVKRTIYIACVPLLCVGIILTKGRAVYLGLPTAMVGGLILLGGAGVLKRVFLGGMLSIVVGAVSFVVMKLGLLGTGVIDRFNSIFATDAAGHGSRFLFWRQHIEQFLKTGFMGRGVRQAGLLSETSYHVAHNDWISIAGMLGIVGLVCFAAFNITLFFRIRAIRDLWTQMFCLMVWCMMLCGGLTEDDYVTKYYVIAAGWLLCLVRENEAALHQPFVSGNAHTTSWMHRGSRSRAGALAR